MVPHKTAATDNSVQIVTGACASSQPYKKGRSQWWSVAILAARLFLLPVTPPQPPPPPPLMHHVPPPTFMMGSRAGSSEPTVMAELKPVARSSALLGVHLCSALGVSWGCGEEARGLGSGPFAPVANQGRPKGEPRPHKLVRELEALIGGWETASQRRRKLLTRQLLEQ